ncbi:MAG: hypothetical protein BWZ10_01441 [candidate division BRC1 bacterium ADurb.BinA364]|nr:MAG: hypothetical protein BWZ10_01441 [candidate division BRC1 bacterium ADurb.BinA364]
MKDSRSARLNSESCAADECRRHRPIFFVRSSLFAATMRLFSFPLSKETRYGCSNAPPRHAENLAGRRRWSPSIGRSGPRRHGRSSGLEAGRAALSRLAGARGWRLRLGRPAGIAPDAFLRRHRLLHPAGPQTAQRRPAGRIRAHTSSVSPQKTRTRHARFRAPTDSKPALAGRGRRRIPRASRLLDAAFGVSAAIRSERLSDSRL